MLGVAQDDSAQGRPLRSRCAAKRKKPPLCKGRWHGVSRDGGIDTPPVILPLLCQNDSPLYTRGPLAAQPHTKFAEFCVIARTLSEGEGDVAISRYDVCYRTANRWMLPGDSHGLRPRNDRKRRGMLQSTGGFQQAFPFYRIQLHRPYSSSDLASLTPGEGMRPANENLFPLKPYFYGYIFDKWHFMAYN